MQKKDSLSEDIQATDEVVALLIQDGEDAFYRSFSAEEPYN